MTRRRRWGPGKGFIKLLEYGSTAVWMKPLKDGALLAAYLPGWALGGEKEYVEKWIVALPRGTDFHWDVLDKPHRIRWSRDDEVPEPGSLLYNVEVLKYELGRPSHKKVRRRSRRRWISWHRGDKHAWSARRKRPWEGDWGMEPGTNIPRKIEAAMLPTFTQQREYQAYMAKLHEQWARQAEL